ncbi:MAG: type II toxin-antitoxin system VapC family toxin [Rhodoferax sp.]|nr:type II toxin-antitoxin system VapC family toxin [Rhodoferax sp.]
MTYMLDTHILIYLIKNKPQSVAQRINALESHVEVCMSFFTFAELLKGAERSTRQPDVIRQLNELTRVIPVRCAVGRELCVHYAKQFTQLRAAGTPIGANDLWIACHALALDATLVTNNTSEFKRVAGLQLENWVT